MSVATVGERRNVQPLTPSIGAEITGVDFGRPLAPEVVHEIWAALLQHQVVFFSDPQVGDDLRAVAEQFGEITPAWPVILGDTAGHPEIAQFDTATGRGKVPRWHADITYVDEPPAVSFLNVVEVPPAGGDTLFASTQAAYDSLSETWKRFVDPLVAVHDFNSWGNGYGGAPAPDLRGQWNGHDVAGLPPVCHPVVRVHPETGRRGLYVDPAATAAIEGLTQTESKATLTFLQEHVVRPEHVVRYRWRPGGLAIWDQRATFHYAVDDYGDAHRVSRRVSLRGDRPFGPTDRRAQGTGA
jgi:alpha-ketoglutarate-dependent taurine dioxygenase